MTANEVYAEIEVLRKHGFSLRRIAAEAGCAANTVRRHLAAGQPPKEADDQAGMVQVRKGADACAVKDSSLPGKSVLPAAANLAPYPDRWRGGAAIGGHAPADSNGKPGGRRSDCKREERRT